MNTIFLFIRLKYEICHQWDGQPVSHDVITLTLSNAQDGALVVSVTAPFFNDPPNPGGAPGQPFPNLWDYEGLCPS